MKKILWVILIITLSACGQAESAVQVTTNTESNLTEPPELSVISNDNKVDAVMGTYSWSYDNGDGTSTGTDAESDIPPRIVHHQTAPLTTNLGSDVKLQFAKTPEKIEVSIWDDSQKVRGVKVEDASFITDEKGYITYEIYAKWDQGSAQYVVKIKVQ